MSEIPQSIENQLFSWESWDQFDTASFGFNTCVLRVPIGPHPVGTKVPNITVDYEHSVIEFYMTEESTKPDFTAKLRLSVEVP